MNKNRGFPKTSVFGKATLETKPNITGEELAVLKRGSPALYPSF
jgi:hypothetical protein